jgi:hypothetical protein
MALDSQTATGGLRPRVRWGRGATRLFRCRPGGLLPSLLLAFSCEAMADTRGWLRYVDGNVLAGQLIESAGQGGLFRSDRFGDVQFAPGEAVFDPAPTPALVPPEPSVAPVVTATAGSQWRPGEWSIGLSGYWQRDNGKTGKDIALDLRSTWNNPGNELKLVLAADYKTLDDNVDNNEQSGSVRWLHDLHGPWILLGAARTKRSTVTIAPFPKLDYLMVQGTAGLGVRKRWTAQDQTLVAAAYDRVMVDLMTIDRRFYTRATSLLVENKVGLWPRVSFGNTLLVYFWDDGSTGIDSVADLSYHLTDRFSVGLRHEYRRNAVNFDLGSFNRLSLTTRFGF